MIKHRRTGLSALAVITAACSFGLMPGSAHATAAPVPFTIDEHVDFNTGVFTFTATGPLCASGTFVDDVKVFAGSATNPKASILITSVYTCDDGSGRWNVLKHLFLTFSPGSFTNTGPTEVLGGTGTYAGATGHGVDNGSTNTVTGIGSGQMEGFINLK
jgi:hypothetical protein